MEIEQSIRSELRVLDRRFNLEVHITTDTKSPLRVERTIEIYEDGALLTKFNNLHGCGAHPVSTTDDEALDFARTLLGLIEKAVDKCRDREA